MNRNLIIVVIVILLAVLAYYMWGRSSAPVAPATNAPADATQPATNNTQTQ